MMRLSKSRVCLRIFTVSTSLLLGACAMDSDKPTLASLKNVKIEIKDVYIDGGLEKALEGYQKFLEDTPETAMTPEAIRRLADLKIEKGNRDADAAFTESDTIDAAATKGTTAVIPPKTTTKPAADMKAPPVVPMAKSKETDGKSNASASGVIADISKESEEEFTKRVSKGEKVQASKEKLSQLPPGAAEDAVHMANAKEAIELYKGLLARYPLYNRNDQVLYQLSRAYEETGQMKKAVKVMDDLVTKYPSSRYFDEAHFRRGEYFFSRKRYLDAEDAYKAVVGVGVGSAFYELALYKRGWSYFKQDMYEEALGDYFTMLDHKLDQGYDFSQAENKLEQKRVEDTYRVISLSFSYLGGAKSVVEFFDKIGPRIYEPSIYSHLGEYFFEKRRYSDAALSYNTYVERNPLNKVAPHFHIRVIEIYLKGGFPKLVVEAKRNFSTTYGLKAQYWTLYDIKSSPTVLAFLKSNIVDLARHFHSLYQNKRMRKFKNENFKESKHWYRTYLESFPLEPQAAEMNYQLAGLMLENKDYRDAAVEYEKTAYNYPKHADAAEAGYSAVYAFREHLKKVSQAERFIVRREVIRSSLRFSETFPEHKSAAMILSAAIDDLYEIKDYEQAIRVGRLLLEKFPGAETRLRRAAWLIVAHASLDITKYKDAEEAYIEVLALTGKKDKSRDKLTENLAASIYKQGEQARKLEDHKTAAFHFLRLGKVTPTASIRSTAEYDGAASLIVLKDWTQAASVLESFRKRYPKHKLRYDITKKLAVVYKESGKLLFAAAEFERIEKESKNSDVRREALLQAAELYEKAEAKDRALVVYLRFVKAFPRPVEFALETRQKIADIYKVTNNKKYIAELKSIVSIDAKAGKERNARTRYLAANAALVLTQPVMDRYTAIKLKKPFKKNLKKKKGKMKKAIDAYKKLINYQVGEVTAAATFYLAEIYFHFSRALMESERPTNLSDLELEQYELVLEEQIFPFEEKAIKVHEKNMELLAAGIYNTWIDRSIEKLAVLVPARYARAEQSSGFMQGLIPVKNRPAIKDVQQVKTDNKQASANIL